MKKIFFKTIQLIITLIIATFFVFLLIQNAPSDPIRMMMTRPTDSSLSSEKEILEKKIEEKREEAGLNDSLMVQYSNWLANVLNGRLGKSMLTQEEISIRIFQLFPNSIYIAITSTILQFIFALIAGILSVIYFGKWQEHLIRLVTIFFRSVPFFAISIYLLSIFAIKYQMFEVSNSADLSRIWLPSLAVGISLFPKLSRIIRNSLLDELGKKYIVSYMSKGFTKYKIMKEALRNAIIPIFTTLSISFAGSLGGMIIAESIFTWPGLGNYGMNSILTQDYPVIQGYILVVTFLVVIVNFLTDILYPIINPVLRSGGNYENNK